MTIPDRSFPSFSFLRYQLHGGYTQREAHYKFEFSTHNYEDIRSRYIYIYIKIQCAVALNYAFNISIMHAGRIWKLSVVAGGIGIRVELDKFLKISWTAPSWAGGTACGEYRALPTSTYRSREFAGIYLLRPLHSHSFINTNCIKYSLTDRWTTIYLNRTWGEPRFEKTRAKKVGRRVENRLTTKHG